jgi:hypothetical protein
MKNGKYDGRKYNDEVTRWNQERQKKLHGASRANWVKVQHVFPYHFRKIAPFLTWIKANITRALH